MTRLTSARVAGAAYILYIALAFPSLMLLSRATKGDGTAAKLAGLAEHGTSVGFAIVLALLGCFAALVLAVTLYGITRDEDHELAMFGLAFRVAEGVLGSIGVFATAYALSLAKNVAEGRASDEASQAAGALLLELPNWTATGSAIFFAVGSTFFCYLLLRGRMIPMPLAWLGVAASVLLVVLLPLRLAGFVDHPMLMLMWAPMAVFELVVALWFLTKGVGGGGHPERDRVS